MKLPQTILYDYEKYCFEGFWPMGLLFCFTHKQLIGWTTLVRMHNYECWPSAFDTSRQQQSAMTSSGHCRSFTLSYALIVLFSAITWDRGGGGTSSTASLSRHSHYCSLSGLAFCYVIRLAIKRKSKIKNPKWSNPYVLRLYTVKAAVTGWISTRTIYQKGSGYSLHQKQEVLWPIHDRITFYLMWSTRHMNMLKTRLDNTWRSCYQDIEDTFL